MQSDPIGALHRLYGWLGEELPRDVQARMAAWWESNSKGRHGSQHYRPDEYGIDVQAVRQLFRFYTERFKVPLDDTQLQ
jgi:hypothetical protein